MSEEQIILLCQQGDLEKFSNLYDSYFDKLYRFVFYRTSHRETAQDITSDIFIKALKKINSFNPNKGSFQSWLFRIARNTVIDYYRSRKTFADLDKIKEPGSYNDISSQIDNQESAEKIKQAMAGLNPTQQEIIILRIWQALPYKDIAMIVGKSEANCKMIFSRTVKQLRTELPLMAFLLLFLSSNY